MSRPGVRAIAAVILLIIAGAANVFATHAVFTSRYPGANDFASRWGGARAFWLDGISPYSDQATRQIQLLIYGRPISPEEEHQVDPGPFAYPFYTVFLIAPLVFLPYAWAEAAWLALLEFALIGGVIGAIRLAEWRLSPILLGMTLVWSVLFYHSARAILLGQFAVVIFALIVVILLALQVRRDALAGVLLALATIKPQMVFLIVPLVLLWAVARKRWRVIAGFAAAMGVLCGASWIAMPSWLGDWVAQMTRYTSYTAIGSPVWVITRYFFPALGAPGEIILSAMLVVWMLVTWLPLWRDESWTAFMWVVSVTLVVTNLVALRTATTNYVVLFIPLVQFLAMIQMRWKRAGTWAVVGLELGLLVGLWVLFLTTVVNKFEHPIVYLPLPLGLLIVVAFGRRWLMEHLTAEAQVS